MNARVITAVPAACAVLVLAACGGSSPSTPAASSSSTSSTSSDAGSSTALSSAGASSTSSTNSTSSPGAKPPEVPRSKARSAQHANHPLPQATGVKIPAAFTIRSGAALSPATIAVPKATPIQVTVRDRDSRAHTVAVASPARRTLRVAPGRTAASLIVGLADGSYRVLVDGRTRGRIIVGSTPGP